MSDINDFGRISLVMHTTGLKERLEKRTMNEHLFKLKKDGKTVGYLKYDKYRPTYNNDLDVFGKYIDEDDDKWLEGVTSDFDEMLPFVTKDRLGKDVFAGDKCKAHVFMEDSPSYLISGEVVYNNCGYCIAMKSTYYHMNDLMNIELTEDEDDD